MKNANFYSMDNRFGDLIRVARLDKGWSQRELARRVKKSPTYIHYVERGYNSSAKTDKMQVGADAVDEIAKALDIPKAQARHAAGYASDETGITLDLGDGIKVILPQSLTGDADRYRQAFMIAYQTVRQMEAPQLEPAEVRYVPTLGTMTDETAKQRKAS